MCPTEVVEIRHLGKFSKDQVTLSRAKNINFATREYFSREDITVNFLVQNQKGRRLISEHTISTLHQKLIYPDAFISGQLLDINFAVNDSVDIAANILTPPPLLYFPSYFDHLSERSILIPTETGENETHQVRKFEFSLRLDDTSYSMTPFLDSLSVEVFPSGRFIGQVYMISFRASLRSLAINGSGYIDINYNRIFKTQKKRQELKRVVSNVACMSEADKKKARLSRFQATSAGSASTASGGQLPMFAAPFAQHALNKAFQGTALSCCP